MPFRRASPSPRRRSALTGRLGDDDRRGAIGLGTDAAGRLLALRADFGRLPLTLGLHPLIDGLAVRLRQIGPADLHVDHVDAEALGFAVDLLGDLATSARRAGRGRAG